MITEQTNVLNRTVQLLKLRLLALFNRIMFVIHVHRAGYNQGAVRIPVSDLWLGVREEL